MLMGDLVHQCVTFENRQGASAQQPGDMLRLTFLLHGFHGGMVSKHRIVWYCVHSARGQDLLSCLKEQQLILLEELLSELRELSCGRRPLVSLRREARRKEVRLCFQVASPG